MSDVPLFSPLRPPSAIVNLEEEQVSNGFLPDVMTGIHLATAMLTLAGQARTHSLILGRHSTSDSNVVRIDASGTFEVGFLLKPGARDVYVSLMFTDQGLDLDGGEEYEVTVGILADSELVERTFSMTTQGGLTAEGLASAYTKSVMLPEVGKYPGRLVNRHDNAKLQVSVNAPSQNTRILLLAVNILQLHTSTIVQEDP